MAPSYYILPFSLNIECLSLTEVVSLLTLCLAPLIAHVASGSTGVSCLVRDRPLWYDKICHYNPTSILWRYAAITDRRIRALSWDQADMAVNNAIFWTSRGWDGSEEMARSAGLYCLRLPDHTRVEILSSAMFKTVLTTAQGISALYWIVYHLVDSTDTDSFISLVGVDNIFVPLSLFGLLRLCAAMWLTDDYAYASRSDLHFKPLPPTPLPPTSPTILRMAQVTNHRSLAKPKTKDARYRSTLYWPSVAFRIAYVSILSIYWVFCAIYAFPISWPSIALSSTMSLTMFLMAFLYLAFLTISIPLLAFFLSRHQRPTIIPCISNWWYRLYTLIMLFYAVAFTTIALMETTKEPQGGYSSIRWDAGATGCHTKIWFTGFPTSIFFGLASAHGNVPVSPGSARVWEPSSVWNASGSELRLYNFTGYCRGIPSEGST